MVYKVNMCDSGDNVVIVCCDSSAKLESLCYSPYSLQKAADGFS